MRTLLAACAALAIAAGTAAGDPRPPGYSGTTCDHAGIESSATSRHVNYLHQRYVGCSHAQHVARLWVHNHECGISGCNVHDGSAYWYCTGRKTSLAGETPEYLATCNSNHNQILIGWVRPT